MRKIDPSTREPRNADPVVGQETPHESAPLHVTGRAIYVDDIAEPAGLLHVVTGQSTVAHGRILSMDLDAVRAAEGVVDVVTHADIPGDPDISPVYSGDLLLAESEVNYVGQPLFAVAAVSLDAARQACQLARIEIAPLPAVLTPQDAMAAEAFVLPTRTFRRGGVAVAIDAAPRQLSGEQYVRGQEHFYLEGQVALALR